MSWEIAQAGLDYMLKHGGQEENPFIGRSASRNFAIAFYGREPLLRMDFLDRCAKYLNQKLVDDRVVSFTVTTNGTLLTPDIIKCLLDNNINIVISLDGPEEIHDRMRVFPNGMGSYNNVIEGIENLVQYASQLKPSTGIPVILNTVLTGNENVVDLLNYFCSMEELFNTPYVNFVPRLSDVSKGTEFLNQNIPELHLEHVQGWDELISEYREACLSGVFYSDNGQQSWRMQVLGTFAREGLFFSVYGRTRYQYDCEYEIRDVCHPGSICAMGAKRAYLMTDGIILPCERVPTDDPYFIIGNILDGGIDLDKVNEKTDEFTNATADDCKNCWSFRMCDVSCLAGMVKDGKVIPSIKKNRCNLLLNRRNDELIGMMELLEENPKSLDHYKNVIVT